VLFLILLILHIMDLAFRAGQPKGSVVFDGFGVMLLTLYVVISLLAAFHYFRTPEPAQNIRRLGYFLMLTAIAWGTPYIANWIFARISGAVSNVVFNFMILIGTQAWLWYLGLAHADDIGKIWKGAFTVYVVILFVALIYSYPAFWSKLQSTEITESGGVGLNSFIVDTSLRTRDTVVAIFTGTKIAAQQFNQTYAQQLQYATGGYYSSEVDKKATVPNEIKIADITPTQPQFRDVDQVSVYATLSTQTLTTEAGNALIECWASTDGSDGRVVMSYRADTLLPSAGTINLRPYDSYDISCSWFPGRFKLPPTKTALINISATFDFSTDGYMKTYWIDRNALVQLRQANQDPYQAYSITDKTLSTTYTPGPVKFTLGLGSGTTQESLKSIDKTVPSMQMLLALQLESQWSGALASLNAVVLQTPRGVRISKVQYPDNTDVVPVKCADLDTQLNQQTMVAQGTTGTGQTAGAAGQTPTQPAATQPAASSPTGAATLEHAKRIPPPCDDKVSNIYLIRPRVSNAKQITLLFVAEISQSDYDAMTPVPAALRIFGATAYYTYRIEAISSVPIIQTTGQTVTTTPGVSLPVTVIGTPTIAPTGSNGIRLSYTTSQPTKDTLRFFPTDGGTMVDVLEDDYATKPETTSHIITINGLTPGVRYSYRITSRDANNQEWVNQQPEWQFSREATA
jgi:hypothetical protein